jgi:hypothetical protein
VNCYTTHNIPLRTRNCLVVRQRCQTGARFASGSPRIGQIPGRIARSFG